MGDVLMIQYWLKDQISAALSGVDVTVDYEPNNDTYVTVFHEGGGDPGRYDLNDRHPNYMVWVQSADFNYAEYLANEIYKLLNALHKKTGTIPITVEYYKGSVLIDSDTVYLQRLSAEGDVNRIGVEDGAMQYTINLSTTILQKEETINE